MRLPKFLRSLARPARNSKRSPMARRLLAVERLEERSLLTAVPTLISLQVSAASLPYRQTETLTATVTVAPPNSGTPSGGSVTFLDGSTSLGTAPLNTGKATLQVSTLPAGTNVLTASYGGNSSFAESATAVRPNSIITTVAGNGSSGDSGDGGSATAASISYPVGIAVDAAGDIFIDDYFNSRIREVVKATGDIITVTGGGHGGAASGIAATTASLIFPQGIAVDSAGNLFIADMGDQLIREVVKATGDIVTVAGGGSGGLGDGGPATAASLDNPQGVAVDAAGNVFIADATEDRIREVVKATGDIITVAGRGSPGYSGNGGPATAASLDYPDSIAVDAAGNLFITDNWSNRVREVVKASGEIITVAGNGSPGYRGDGGPATAASLDSPRGIAVDAAGNLFISDVGNGRIREVVKASGDIITVAGGGDTGLGDGGPATAASIDPTCVALDAAGNLFIADGNNSRVREVYAGMPVTITPATPTVSVTDGGTNNANPFAATALVAGVVSGVDATPTPTLEGVGLTLDYLKLNADGSTAADLGSTAPTAGGSYAVTATFAGSADYSAASARTTFTIAQATTISLVARTATAVFGQPVTLTATVSSSAGTPAGTVTFMDGTTLLGSPVTPNSSGVATLHVSTLPVGTDLLTASYGGDSNFAESTTAVGPNSTITTVAGNGTAGFSGDNGPATNAELGLPNGVAMDSAGDLFIADSNDRIREVNHATGVITTVAGNGVWGFSGDNGPATAAELDGPSGIAVDSAGDLFITDGGNDRIREVNHATGVITTIAGDGIRGHTGDNGPATAAALDEPFGITLDAAGDLFIADSGNNRIREVNHATGLITTVAGNGTAGYGGDNGPATAAELYRPSGIAVDAVGDLFIADSGNNRIREVNHATGVITTVAGNGTAGFSGDNGPATAAELGYPNGIAMDSAGDLFIGDSSNNRIREVNHATGVITTVAGNGIGGFSGDNGPASAAELGYPTGMAMDSAGDLFIADYGSFVLREVASGAALVTVTPPAGSFSLAGPSAGAYVAGQSVTIGWTAGIVAGHVTKISLAYGAEDAPFSAEHWIEVDGITATSNTGSYHWNNAGVAPGTYYLAGYSYDFSTNKVAFTQLSTKIVITGGALPALTLGGPTAGTFSAGVSVTIQWSAANVDVAGPTKISLGYDAGPTAFDANESWIEVDRVTAANGTGSYAWNTSGAASGTYYLSGYMYDFSTSKAVYSSLGKSIVITGGAPTAFTFRGPSAGTFSAGQSVTIAWTAANVDVAGSTKITLGYDSDATPFDANQHWLEINRVTAANGAGAYSWNTTGVAAGTYYLSGYMYDFATSQAVYSHLGTSIVIT